MNFTLPDAEQAILRPSQNRVLLGVQFLCSSLGGCPGAGESSLCCADKGCWAQGDAVHGGAAVGTHLSCSSCDGTTRAGGMCSLLSSHVHLFSQCSAAARIAPPASSTCLLWDNSLLRTFTEAKEWGMLWGDSSPH